MFIGNDYLNFFTNLHKVFIIPILEMITLRPSEAI